MVTVATLCTAFLAYITSHPEEYRDQKNPPRRIEEIRKAFEGRLAAGDRRVAGGRAGGPRTG
jgi:hypothetical protein